VLGVSPDSVESHRKFRAALKLPFNLLSDPDFVVSDLYDSTTTKTLEDGTTIPRVRRSHYTVDGRGTIVDVQNPVKAAESADLALEKL
jgi:thioredoxin-dependent peroxiredoxin